MLTLALERFVPATYQYRFFPHDQLENTIVYGVDFHNRTSLKDMLSCLLVDHYNGQVATVEIRTDAVRPLLMELTRMCGILSTVDFRRADKIALSERRDAESHTSMLTH